MNLDYIFLLHLFIEERLQRYQDGALGNFVLVPSPHYSSADKGDKPDKTYDDILEGG